MPSVELVGSSVISKRRWFHPRSAEATAAAVPAVPVHDSSARYEPGWAGCGVQSSDTAAPSTPPTAHSMCGQRAEGAECT